MTTATDITAPDRSGRPAVQADHRVGGRPLLIALGITVGLAAGIGVGTAWLIGAVAPVWSDADHLGAIISAEVYLAVLVAHLIVFGGTTGLRDRLRWRTPTVRQLGLAFAVWLACWAGAVLVHLVAAPVVGSVDELGRAVQLVGSDVGRLSGAAPALLVIVVVRACLLAPVAEEVLFRGSLYGWLRGHVSATVAIALTAVMFAAMHQMAGLVAITLLLGVGAAWVRERTGSIAPFMAMHVLTVVVMITFSYLTVGWNV